jgi:hypothetical protein
VGALERVSTAVRWRLRYLRERRAVPSFTLAACAIFKDEAPYLAEWVTFHRLQGVEKFWLYDNESADDWRLALRPKLESGLVEVASFPGETQQTRAYADCLGRHRLDARWIAFIDIDEFLFSPTGQRLPQVLASFGRVPAVVANWRTYGTSGHREPPDGLVTEHYVWRVRDDLRVNQHVKSIVYPLKTSTWVQNPHMFRHYGKPVGEDRIPGRPAAPVWESAR